MATKFSYQTVIGAVPGPLITREGSVMSGTALMQNPPASPEEVQVSSEAVLKWFESLQKLEWAPEGNADFPFTSSVEFDKPKKGQAELVFKAGGLERKAIYDHATRKITTTAAPAFTCSVYSWLRMHGAYKLLIQVAKAME
jgi:hypothetical protein